MERCGEGESFNLSRIAPVTSRYRRSSESFVIAARKGLVGGGRESLNSNLVLQNFCGNFCNRYFDFYDIYMPIMVVSSFF